MRYAISIFTAVVLLLVACSDEATDTATIEADSHLKNGSGTEQTTEPSGVSVAADPCSVLSDHELSEILPHAVAGSVLAPGLCEYGSGDINLGRVNVQVFIQNVAATGCDLFFSVGGFESAEPIEGVGSSARWKGEVGADQLGVCVDEQWAFTVLVYDPENMTDPLAVAREAGKQIVANLSLRQSA